MSRVKDDDSLKDMMPKDGPNFIEHPIIIASADGDKQNYLISVSELDPMGQEPKLFGIMLSDMIDHIAAAYVQTTGRDEAEIRETLIRTLRKEDKFKTRDPNRAPQRGYQPKITRN